MSADVPVESSSRPGKVLASVLRNISIQPSASRIVCTTPTYMTTSLVFRERTYSTTVRHTPFAQQGLRTSRSAHAHHQAPSGEGVRDDLQVGDQGVVRGVPGLVGGAEDRRGMRGREHPGLVRGVLVVLLVGLGSAGGCPGQQLSAVLRDPERR